MKKHYIYSTLANNVSFVNYKKDETNAVSAHDFDSFVMIYGGNGVVDKVNGSIKGIAETVVTDEEMKFLLTDPSFNDFVEKKYLMHSSKQLTIDEAKDKMSQNDGGKPLNAKKSGKIIKERYKDDSLKVYASGVAIV